MDEDGSGAIGVDELEDPLIALGLVENRQQVQEIVDLVDEDGSNQIEFGEFLSIIKGGSNNSVSCTHSLQRNKKQSLHKKLSQGEALTQARFTRSSRI